MNDQIEDSTLEESLLEQARVERELSFLFGEDVARQASLIDAADLKLNDVMTQFISNGVTQLKRMKDAPELQKKFVEGMAPGECLVLCMWIIEMGLLNKIQGKSYCEK